MAESHTYMLISSNVCLTRNISSHDPMSSFDFTERLLGAEMSHPAFKVLFGLNIGRDLVNDWIRIFIHAIIHHNCIFCLILFLVY